MTKRHSADLHMHSTFSDGEMAPSELVGMAVEQDIEVMSLTDHDTVAGVDEALRSASRLPITVIPGIEVTLRFARPGFTGSLHILLYFSKSLFRNPVFTSTLNSVVSKGRGTSLVRSRIVRINEEFGPGGKAPLLRKPLMEDEVFSFADNVSRRHFALALSEFHGLDKSDVSRLIGNDSPAYLPSGVDMEVLRPLIAEYPVTAVLAHPAAGSFPGESHYREVLPPLEIVEELLPEFLDLGISGLEVYYPGHTEEHIQRLLELTNNLDLIATGGSDCHDREQRPMCPVDPRLDPARLLSTLDPVF